MVKKNQDVKVQMVKKVKKVKKDGQERQHGKVQSRPGKQIKKGKYNLEKCALEAQDYVEQGIRHGWLDDGMLSPVLSEIRIICYLARRRRWVGRISWRFFNNWLG